MKVVHDTEQQRFFIGLEEEGAVLAYRRIEGSDGVNFYHTFVPFKWRGQGYAEKLVECGLEWARGENLEITASCWFVQKHL